MKMAKITLKAIWLALKDWDFKSAFKLLNFKKNREFISKLNVTFHGKKKIDDSMDKLFPPLS